MTNILQPNLHAHPDLFIRALFGAAAGVALIGLSGVTGLPMSQPPQADLLLLPLPEPERAQDRETAPKEGRTIRD